MIVKTWQTGGVVAALSETTPAWLAALEPILEALERELAAASGTLAERLGRVGVAVPPPTVYGEYGPPAESWAVAVALPDGTGVWVGLNVWARPWALHHYSVRGPVQEAVPLYRWREGL